MLDVLGAISVTAIAILVVGTYLLGADGSATRRRLGFIAVAWFVAMVAVGGAGLFRLDGAGAPVVGTVLVVSLVSALLAYRRSPALRSMVGNVPTAGLVAINAFRLFGVFFVALHAAGRLPPTFALTAGIGDMVVGLAAVPLAWMVHRRAAGWRTATVAWNAIGMADLLVAVTLGVGSAANSPLRFIHEAPESGTIGNLPWVLIPTFLVPLYLLSHVAIFAKIAERSPGRVGLARPTTA